MLFSLLIVCSGCGKTAETGMNPDEMTVEVSYKNFFGVCGTGLIYRNEKIAGRSAQINTYKDFDNWSFITFDGEIINLF